MQYVINRAASDPQFRLQLAEDPLEVARSMGYSHRIEEVKDLLDLGDIDCTELCDQLHLRLSRLDPGKWM
jgi:hypothetical protein